MCFPAQGPECHYEDTIFAQYVLDTIAAHNASEPMFYSWCPHIVHAPLEAPTAALNRFNFMGGVAKGKQEYWRQLYMSMVSVMDTAIGQVVDRLKAKAMYNDTLIVFSADNGGPIYWSGIGGANNWPLRGGKGSNWEGGASQLVGFWRPDPAYNAWPQTDGLGGTLGLVRNVRGLSRGGPNRSSCSRGGPSAC